MSVPVLYIAFNRPDTTTLSFDVIKSVRPSKLFIAVDGPRTDISEDYRNCAEVKRILSDISWDCNVWRLYHETNLGCGISVCRAIDWFFSHVDYGVILEDDLIAETSFFSFCEELLEMYKDDSRVMMISGLNILGKHHKGQNSYFFSRFGFTHGWASWKRAWLKNDFYLNNYRQFQVESDFKALIPEPKRREYIQFNLNNILRNNRKDIWDYQWEFSKLMHGGMSIVPTCNLIQNVGFGSEATHTKSPEISINKESISFPLNHPSFIYIDESYDHDSFQKIIALGESSLLNRSASSKIASPENSAWPWTLEDGLSNDFSQHGEWPMISIVLVSMNEAELLELTLRSIILQGYPYLQLIVIDCGSDREALEIIFKYEQHITYFRTYPNIKYPQALNIGLKLCRGTIFNWVIAGDYFHFDAFKVIASHFSEGHFDVLSFQRSIIDIDNNCFHDMTLLEEDVEKTILAGRMVQASTFWRKDVFRVVGEFDETLEHTFHLNAWLKYLLIYGQQRVFICPQFVVARSTILRTFDTATELYEKERFSIYHSLLSFLKVPENYLKIVENLVDIIRVRTWSIHIDMDERRFIQSGMILLSQYFFAKQKYLMADMALSMVTESE